MKYQYIKFKVLLVLSTFVMFMCGCTSTSNLTPRQHDRLARKVFNAEQLAIAGAEAAAKLKGVEVPIEVRAVINERQNEVRQRLYDSAVWLRDNPTLADVPGIYPPTLDPINRATDALKKYANKYLGIFVLGDRFVPSTPEDHLEEGN